MSGAEQFLRAKPRVKPPIQLPFPGPAEEKPWQSGSVEPNERRAGRYGPRMFPNEPDPPCSGLPGGSPFPVVVARRALSSCGAIPSKAGKSRRYKLSTTATPALSEDISPTRDCGRSRMSRVRPPPGYRLTEHHLQTPNSPSVGLPSCRHRNDGMGCCDASFVGAAVVRISFLDSGFVESRGRSTCLTSLIGARALGRDGGSCGDSVSSTDGGTSAANVRGSSSPVAGRTACS